MTIAEFENIWISKINNELLKEFPTDFIDKTICSNLEMPGKALSKGSELFGNYEIADTDGKTFIQTDDIFKLKYILYSNKNKPNKILIPTDETKLKEIVKLYETHLDNLIKIVEQNFSKTFQSSKEFNLSSNKIFTSINLSRY